jgi:ParB family chromosome partitioning protein
MGASVNSAHVRMNAELTATRLDAVAGNPREKAMVREYARRGAASIREALEAELKPREIQRTTGAAMAATKPARVTAAVAEALAVPAELPVVNSMQVFDWVLGDSGRWFDRFDPASLGPQLTRERWARLEATVEATVAFLDTARAARDAAAGAGRPRLPLRAV